ncbi:hypothetical protein [Stigmatella erecta]|uniref:Uncharacterized protein n=1 Tax=Stigmatella erecta TaxID=83460 RepID=A0A1I0KJX1_9BACT|nr:hypothetical protein [Stigmatella erecta]SEU24284.1 hypothetical protein SAMN05443639_11134 [Stigmatella erecta]
MARRKKPEDESTRRVRNLIALDAALIMRRLEARRDEMFVLFSRLRSREPMLTTLATRFTSATFHDLVHLPEKEQAVVHGFHERLDELRWYFTYTEDMPGTVQQTFIVLHRRLEEAYRQLVVALGPPLSPQGAVVVEAEPVRPEPSAPGALTGRPRLPRRG